jgi:hypothetical protein
LIRTSTKNLMGTVITGILPVPVFLPGGPAAGGSG